MGQPTIRLSASHGLNGSQLGSLVTIETTERVHRKIQLRLFAEWIGKLFGQIGRRPN